MAFRSISTTLTLVAAACAAATHSHAQDATQTVVVTGRTAPSAGVAGFDDVPLSRAPFSATVLGADALGAGGIGQLAQAARLEAGVSDAYNSEGYWSNFTIRGFTLDPRANYRRDGLPINAETALWLGNKQALEVLKGASGLQAGTSVPGGLVNLLVKRPQAGRVRSATLDVQGAGTVGAAVDLGDRAGDGGPVGGVDRRADEPRVAGLLRGGVGAGLVEVGQHAPDRPLGEGSAGPTPRGVVEDRTQPVAAQAVGLEVEERPDETMDARRGPPPHDHDGAGPGGGGPGQSVALLQVEGAALHPTVEVSADVGDHQAVGPAERHEHRVHDRAAEDGPLLTPAQPAQEVIARRLADGGRGHRAGRRVAEGLGQLEHPVLARGDAMADVLVGIQREVSEDVMLEGS